MGNKYSQNEYKIKEKEFIRYRQLARDTLTARDFASFGSADEDITKYGVLWYETAANSLQDKYGFKDPSGDIYARKDPREIVYKASKPIDSIIKLAGKNTLKLIKDLISINRAAKSVRPELAKDNTRYPSEYGVTPIHIAKQGETIDGISNKYGVSKQDIIGKNQFLQNRDVKAGDRIVIPKEFDLDELQKLNQRIPDQGLLGDPSALFSGETFQTTSNPLHPKGGLNSQTVASYQDVLWYSSPKFDNLGNVMPLNGVLQGYVDNFNEFLYYSDDYKTFLKNQDYIEQLNYLSEPAYGLSYEHFNTYQNDPFDNSFLDATHFYPNSVVNNTPSLANTSSNDGLKIGGIIGSLGTGIGLGTTMGSLGVEVGAGTTAMGGAGIWAGVSASANSIGAALAAAGASIGSAIAAAGAAVAAAGSSIWGAILGLLFFL